jgi:uncharacterized protein
MHGFIVKSIGLISWMLWFGVVSAQQFPAIPDPPRLVNDYTGTLTAAQQQALESKLVAFNDSTSTQIAVVIVPSTEGFPISQYAVELAERWGIGRRGKDNGVLVLVAREDRQVFIAVGYGLEGAIPDALAKRIIEEKIIPAFSNGHYYEGLEQATTTLMKLATGEFTAENLKPAFRYTPLIIFIFFLLFILLVAYLNYRSVRHYADVNHLDLYTAWQLMNATRRIQRGAWGHFTSGFDMFGKGGGFSGFGGGSFGGGGAGGRW